MLLSLVTKDGISVAQKELKENADFNRVSNATVLLFRGEHYKFVGIGPNNLLFEHCEAPIIVDGFVEQLRS